MRNLATAQIVALALTNIMLFNVGTVNISLAVALMALFVPAVVLTLMYNGRHIYMYKMHIVIIYMIGVFCLHFGNSRPSSIAYSILLVAFFVAIMNYLRREHNPERFGSIMKAVFYGYFFNIVIAQMLQLTNLANDITRLVFQVNDDYRYEGLRYQGFSSEPSYAAFVVMVAYYVSAKLSHDSRRSRILMFIMLLYMTVSFNSVYGYFLIVPVVVASHSQLFRRHGKASAISAMLLLAVFLSYSIGKDNSRPQRILNGISHGQILDPHDINEMDNSTYIRVGTFLEYLLTTDLTEPEFYLGHGAMSHMYELGWKYRGLLGINDEFGERILRPGFSLGFLYDYGLVGLLLMLWVIRKFALRSWISFEMFIVVMMFFNANFNTLLFWFIITAFAAMKLYSQRMPAPVLLHEPAPFALGDISYAHRS